MGQQDKWDKYDFFDADNDCYFGSFDDYGSIWVPKKHIKTTTGKNGVEYVLLNGITPGLEWAAGQYLLHCQWAKATEMEEKVK